MGFESLGHVWMGVPGYPGMRICVLDQGAIIGPEEAAMACALHSRSTGGIQKHLDIIAEKGAEKFLQQYYVGYGHKSIGDCGSGYVFVEGLSMLAAKAIQNWRLYNGQEASTRYIPFDKQPILNPLGVPEGDEILEAWRSFYLRGVQALPEVLKGRYPIGEDENEKVYEKAIAARSFDIMRAFLPAGTTTNVAWFVELRQFTDQLLVLRNHPLVEVRAIARTVEAALIEAFPNSFSDKRYEDTEEYYAEAGRLFTYLEQEPREQDFAFWDRGIDFELLEDYREILGIEGRGSKVELPQEVAETGTMRAEFLLDFGSWRDMQRHRAPLANRMPLVVTDHGFEEWYLRELPDAMRGEAEEFIEHQTKAIANLKGAPTVKQYYTAMGFNLPCRIVGDLRAMTYFVERRANRFVHPTLCKRAVQLANAMRSSFEPYGLKLLLDEEPHRFDVRRGEHDIVKTT